MGNLTHLMVHCSDTDRHFNVTPEHIAKWHLQERGWSRVGYSLLIRRNGYTDVLIPFNDDEIVDPWEISNGATGWNGTARHICYAGGRVEGGSVGAHDNRTPEQKAALIAIIKMMILMHPDIRLIGHNQVNALKYCPSFNVPDWCSKIGILEKNIDRNFYHRMA